ncbi:MAG: helix-turn-helix transcriptional regulator [Bryobacterales bacterium]|nr:helix-turn-helix transcriptional regulator [Bryobacterales bacterium]
MIKNDAQRVRTQVQIDGFRQAQAKFAETAKGKRAKALNDSYASMIEDLESQIQEYDQLKSGLYKLPVIERLDQVAPFIVRLRIAKGVSQTALAKRLGVSKQVISRHEEEEYQSVSIARLQEILDALAIKTQVRLTA